MKLFYIALIFFFIFKINAEEKYSRNAFQFNSYSTNTNIGYYTKKYCKTNIDHVVSLKDAFDSGAFNWTLEQKKDFANDKENHVPACHRINSSKGSATPKDFLRRSNDKKGLEYEIINFCDYVNIYFKIKKKYNLSFKNNDTDLFNKCFIKLKN
jgi:hypothetical protein